MRSPALPENDTLIGIAATVVPMAAVAGSLATLFWLFVRHIDGRPLLEFEPRRPVPWNVIAPLAVLAPTLSAILSGLIGVEAGAPPAAPSQASVIAAATTVQGLVAGPAAAAAAAASFAATAGDWTPPAEEMGAALMIVLQAATFILLAVACHVILAAAFRATPLDLGWPTSWQQLRSDARMGAAAWLAALVPVYGIQLFLAYVLEPEMGHPLVEQLTTQHSPWMIAAAVAAAVFAAPLFEETAFRLVFQGWLERFRLGRPAWAPILVSGTLFALAHVGHGVAPVSLLPFGMTLGYLYQRTHRLVPSMVCHALFNGFSLLMLWLALLLEMET